MRYQSLTRLTLTALTLVCTSFFTSCFTPVGDDVFLPFEEKLVIRGILVVGEQLNDIQISRTLPVLDTFSYNKIFIADAKASIAVGGQTFPMELQTRMTTASVVVRSLYRVPNVRVEAGKTYTLTVEWQTPAGKTLKASASTTTPLLPNVDSVRVLAAFTPNLRTMRIDTIFQTDAFVKARANESMRVGTVVYNQAGLAFSNRGFGDAVFSTTGTVLGTTTRISSNNWQLTTATVQVLNASYRSRAIIETYDMDYFKYYQTRNRSGQPSPLNPGGPNIDWNVAGDGVGMFIGMAQVQVFAPVRRP